MGEQPAPVWGQRSCPKLLGSPSGHRCKASSLMSCIGGKAPSVCLARLFSHASELRNERSQCYLWTPEAPQKILFTLGSGVGEVGALVLTVLPEGVKLHRQAA